MKPGSTSGLFVLAWLLAGVVFCVPQNARAEGIFASQLGDIKTAFVSGDWDLYCTGFSWHTPWQYGAEERHRLNERAWGGGFGRSFVNKRGDKSSLFLMGFVDSHNDTQFSGGYMWNRYWSIARGVDVGLGYSVFLFSRADVANHLPIPAALPCAALRFGRGELIAYYCPHVSEAIPGEVVFIFTRFGF